MVRRSNVRELSCLQRTGWHNFFLLINIIIRMFCGISWPGPVWRWGASPSLWTIRIILLVSGSSICREWMLYWPGELPLQWMVKGIIQGPPPLPPLPPRKPPCVTVSLSGYWDGILRLLSIQPHRCNEQRTLIWWTLIWCLQNCGSQPTGWLQPDVLWVATSRSLGNDTMLLEVPQCLIGIPQKWPEATSVLQMQPPAYFCKLENASSSMFWVCRGQWSASQTQRDPWAISRGLLIRYCGATGSITLDCGATIFWRPALRPCGPWPLCSRCPGLRSLGGAEQKPRSSNRSWPWWLTWCGCGVVGWFAGNLHLACSGDPSGEF